MQRPAKPFTPVRFRLQPPIKKKLAMKKILLTGAAGFIGSNVIFSLLDHGYKILGIDNLNTYYDVKFKKNRLERLKSHLNSKNFQFIKLDIADFSSLHDSVKDFQPDLIINLAAQAGVRYSLENPKTYIESNINGFFNVLEIAKNMNIRNVIYASSSSIYGNSKDTPFNEESTKIQPISLYAATKASNEIMAKSYAYNFNMQLVGLRFFTVYGPEGRPDMAYFSFTNKILNDEKITIFNQGKMSRDMTYIDDIVNGVVASINYIKTLDNSSHEVFNLGNENPVSVMKLIDFISNTLDKKYTFEFKDQNTEVDITFANIEKARTLLNYKPQISFEEGMTNFLNWHKGYKTNK